MVREETRSGSGADAGSATTPVAFRAAVAAMQGATLRPEVFCEEMPAPQRIAPYATALSADVTLADTEVGTGRLILLYDPAGNDAWGGGTFRCVAYVRAELDAELVSDEMLGQVGWSWLLDALDAHAAHHLAASGSVTRVATESFGAMADEDTAQIEIRASWTPVTDGPVGSGDTGDTGDSGDTAAGLAAHVEAWGELLCTAAGLPPVPDGVTVMPTRRGQRGSDPR